MSSTDGPGRTHTVYCTSVPVGRRTVLATHLHSYDNPSQGSGSKVPAGIASTPSASDPATASR